MVAESDPLVQIFSDIEEEHRALTSLLARLPIERLAERSGGQWSAIDLLTHITAWQENALQVARQQAAPGAAELDPAVGAGRVLGLDTDSFNAGLLETHRDWTLDRALAWHNQVFASLRAALATLPPASLLGGPGPHGSRIWYARPALLHSRDHRQEFERRLGA
jgi:hypothetical protein